MQHILLRDDGIYQNIESFDPNYINTCFLTYEIPSKGRIQYMIDDYHTSCIENLSVNSVTDFFSKLTIYINQEYVHVYYDGETLEFHINSILVDWSNVISTFVSEFSNNSPVEFITICRIVKVDNSKYQAAYLNKEMLPIYKLPLATYLDSKTSNSLKMCSLKPAMDVFSIIQNDSDKYSKLLIAESQQCVIYTSLYQNSTTRTRSKLSIIQRKIIYKYTEIFDVYIDSISNSNTKNNNVGISYQYIIRFINGDVKRIQVDYTKSCISEDVMYRDFCLKYGQEFQN